MTKHDEAVEAMARADYERHGLVWEEASEGVRDVYLFDAALALAALRAYLAANGLADLFAAAPDPLAETEG